MLTRFRQVPRSQAARDGSDRRGASGARHAPIGQLVQRAGVQQPTAGVSVPLGPDGRLAGVDQHHHHQPDCGFRSVVMGAGDAALGHRCGRGVEPRGPVGTTTARATSTVAQVDIAAVSATTFLAGVLLGFGAPGSVLNAAPNSFAPSQTGPNLTAMVGTKGLCQVRTDNTTTVGHTLNVSSTSTHTGQVSDTGGTSFTLGSTIGVALQAVTVSAGPKLVWAKIDIPFSI